MPPATRVSGQPRRAAGYTALVARHGLDVIPNWHSSWVLTRGVHRREVHPEGIEEGLPGQLLAGATAWGDHLAFALKYDGTNLGVLAALFRKVPRCDVLAYVAARPTGKYARRGLVPVRVPHRAQATPSTTCPGSAATSICWIRMPTTRRRRAAGCNVSGSTDNLLGDDRFCPTVRRTETLRRHEAMDPPGEGVAKSWPDTRGRCSSERLATFYEKENEVLVRDRKGRAIDSGRNRAVRGAAAGRGTAGFTVGATP